MIISVEGNIGSGKSTLVKLLKEKLPCDKFYFLQEPVKEWEKIKDENNITILEKFYNDQNKYAFSFQMMAYISRLAMLKKAIKEFPDHIIITERCLNTDRFVFAKMLHDDKKIEKINYNIYLKWFDNFINECKIDYHIYVKVNPKICFERIKIRNREGENIPIEYLIKCDNYHNDWLDSMDNVLIINNELDNNNMQYDFNNILNEIQPIFLLGIN